MHNRPLFHPEVNIMLLIFSCTEYVFGLLVCLLNHLLFISWIIVCPLSAYYILYFPLFAILVFSSVFYPWIHPSMLKISGPTPVALSRHSPRTCNRLERSLARKIVSNMLWKHAELTDEAVDWFCKLKTAMEILAAAVPSKDIALFATLDADDTCLECILDDVTDFNRTIKDSFSNANDDHLMSMLESAATFMEAKENSIATAWRDLSFLVLVQPLSQL